MKQVTYYQTEDGRAFRTANEAKSAEEAALLGIPLLRSLDDRFMRAEDVAPKSIPAKAQFLLLWLRENKAAILSILDVRV